MTQNLLKEFTEGYCARIDFGDTATFHDCPYYASSPSGDAWLAGYAHACNKFAGNAAAQEPIVKVTHGRGYTVNAFTMTKNKLVYKMGPGFDYAHLVTA